MQPVLYEGTTFTAALAKLCNFYFLTNNDHKKTRKNKHKGILFCSLWKDSEADASSPIAEEDEVEEDLAGSSGDDQEDVPLRTLEDVRGNDVVVLEFGSGTRGRTQTLTGIFCVHPYVHVCMYACV